MHQNQILDLPVDGIGRPSETIQNLILMHKLIRIHIVHREFSKANWKTSQRQTGPLV